MQGRSEAKEIFRRSQQNADKGEIRKMLMTPPRYDSKPAENIIKLNDKIILEALKQGNFKTAQTLLQELQSTIQKTQYNGNKKMFFHSLSVCYYNKAFVNQSIQQYQQCAKSMQQAVTNFQLIQGYVLSRQQNVAFNVQYIKLLLQHCAVMSQNSRHKQSIIYAQKSLNKLIQCFRVLQAICYQYLLFHNQPETTETSTQSRTRVDKVDFKHIVIKQAQRNLVQLSNLPSTHKLLAQNKQYFQKIMKNIYYWKNNIQNNQKIVRKQLDLSKGISSPRNILGVQKTSSWVDQFHIGTLMTLKPRQMKLSMNTDTYYLLSYQKILQLVLYSSACYFTIATQTRFSQFDEDLDSLKIIQKYKKLHKDQTISKCKLLHLKAIQLAGKYLPPSNDFFNHLLNSFNKNYKFVLDQIKQQSEMTIRQFKAQQLPQQLTSQYGIVRPSSKLLQKKIPRKRSKTNDKEKKKKMIIQTLKKSQLK